MRGRTGGSAGGREAIGRRGRDRWGKRTRRRGTEGFASRSSLLGLFWTWDGRSRETETCVGMEIAMDVSSTVDLGQLSSWIVNLTRTSAIAFPAPPDAPGDFVDHGDGPSGMDGFVKATAEDAFCA
jgi:hypothetical protein